MKITMTTTYCLFGALLLNVACSAANFAQTNSALSSSQDVTPITPVTPVTPVTPPTPLPAPTRNNGVCTPNQQLTSCMQCQAPSVTPWVPSTKADKLAEIMALSCGIKNASDPASYNTTQPTIYQIRSALQACTATALPDSTLTGASLSTINSLLNTSDSSMRNKFFGGLWYQPPYTDYFEAYFGVEPHIIREILCYGADPVSNLSGTDYTTAYEQNCGPDASSSTCSAWMSNAAAQAQWNSTQTSRAQLASCIEKSISLPPITPPATPTCYYSTYSGYYQLGGAEAMSDLASGGYTNVSVEYNNTCYNPSNISSLPAITTGLVTIAGYYCK